MGWYELTSLISDSRVKFLLVFVVFAIAVAIALTILEIRLKRRKEKVKKKLEDESYVNRAMKVLRSRKGPRQKLDGLDKVAKAYFKEHFGTNLNSSYSFLIDEFEKTKRVDFLDFCNSIFKAYYSREEINKEKVDSIGKLFRFCIFIISVI